MIISKNKEKFYQGLKVVAGYLANYKSDLIVLSFFGVASALANGAVPYLAGRFFDAILDTNKIFINTVVEMPLMK